MSDIQIKKVRPILEDELVNGEVIKKGDVFETELADYLLHNYSNRRELVEDSKEESKAEKKAEKKVSKKK